MAAPQKDGLDYFPFEVRFFADKKIKRLRAKFGNDGICVLIYIYTQIYAEGYYIVFDDDLVLDISDELNISENLTRQIINYLFGRSLLSGTLAESVKVLTAASIQRRYQEAKKGIKRDVVVKAEYWLLPPEDTLSFIKVRPPDGNSEKNGSNSEKNGSNSEKNGTKESKEKQNKQKDSKRNYPSSSGSASAGNDGKREVVAIGVREQIGYNDLLADAETDVDMLHDLVELMVDVMSSNRKTMQISGDTYDMNTVKKRFREITGDHITFVIDCMHENTTRIRNIRSYLISTLFNAPITMNSFYSSRVRSDMTKKG